MSHHFNTVTLPAATPGTSIAANDIEASGVARLLVVAVGSVPLYLRKDTPYRVYRSFDGDDLVFVDLVPQ